MEMKLFFNKLKRIVQAGRAAKAARREAEIRSRFRLAERGGHVFVMCGETAVCKMPQAAQVKDVTDMLESMRNAALLYDRLSAASASVCLNKWEGNG